jgi:hypothetical protein
MTMLARLPASLRSVPIYSGDPPVPIPCEWLGVAHVSGDGPHRDRETFILYFLDQNGDPQETLQFETLQIALDQANAICGSFIVPLLTTAPRPAYRTRA